MKLKDKNSKKEPIRVCYNTAQTPECRLKGRRNVQGSRQGAKQITDVA